MSWRGQLTKRTFTRAKDFVSLKLTKVIMPRHPSYQLSAKAENVRLAWKLNLSLEIP